MNKNQQKRSLYTKVREKDIRLCRVKKERNREKKMEIMFSMITIEETVSGSCSAYIPPVTPYLNALFLLGVACIMLFLC